MIKIWAPALFEKIGYLWFSLGKFDIRMGKKLNFLKKDWCSDFDLYIYEIRSFVETSDEWWYFFYDRVLTHRTGAVESRCVLALISRQNLSRFQNWYVEEVQAHFFI